MTLNTCASSGLFGVVDVVERLFVRRLRRSGTARGCLPSGEGKCLAIASSSSVTPTPLFASVKRIGTTCPSSIAFSNGGVQRGVIRLFAAEVFLHQVFVHLDDLIENGGVAALDGVEIGFAFGVEQAFDDRLAAAGGQIDRQAFGAEGVADLARRALPDRPPANRSC